MISEFMSLEEEGVDMSEDIRQREKLSTIAAIVEVRRLGNAARYRRVNPGVARSLASPASNGS
jgi:hypothetical protein